MRTITLIILLVLSQLLGQAQVKERLFYQIHVDHLDPIEQNTLVQAKSLEDIIAYYPSSWIGTYEKTEVIVQSLKGRKVAQGKNQILNEQQRELLKTANLEDFVTIKVYARSMNSTSNKIESHVMERTFGVVPDNQAWYEGGLDATKAYLKQSVVDKMSAAQYNGLKEIEVQFYINEHGKAEAISFTKMSEDKSLHALLIQALEDMPKWHPAINNGKPVKQPCRLILGDAKLVGC